MLAARHDDDDDDDDINFNYYIIIFLPIPLVDKFFRREKQAVQNHKEVTSVKNWTRISRTPEPVSHWYHLKHFSDIIHINDWEKFLFVVEQISKQNYMTRVKI